MRTPIKVFALLTLSIISILASWQGAQAGAMVSARSDVCHNITVAQAKARVRLNTTIEPARVENITPSIDENNEPPMSDVQSGNQYTLNEPDSRQKWALEQIQALPQPQTDNKAPVLVAILDTGIDRDHEDLSDTVVAEINFTDSETTDDLHGHGTHIAGIICASNDNDLGIIGLAPESRLVNIKVANDKGRCKTSALIDGIIWAVDTGANVINVSIELRESTPELAEAIDYAWENGAIVIAAAGNDGSESPVYPAGYENCVGVTALREDGTLAPLANHGDWVDAAAPGLNIYSTLPDDNYGYKHGTSFATAYVSGLAALLFSEVTDANSDGKLNDDVRQAIYSGCSSSDVDGTGKGIINVTGSLAEVTAIPKYSP